MSTMFSLAHSTPKKSKKNWRRLRALLASAGVKQSALSRDTSRVSFIRWDELAKQTPQWLKAEVNTAFKNKAQFFFDITQQTRRAIGKAVAGDPSAYAQFLVEETPVLLYCYYLFRGGVVDVYPGEIADYFWRLEASDYAEELPQATALATSHEGLAYIDFREIRQIIPVQSSV